MDNVNRIEVYNWLRERSEDLAKEYLIAFSESEESKFVRETLARDESEFDRNIFID